MSFCNLSPAGAIAHIDHCWGNATSIHKNTAEDRRVSSSSSITLLLYSILGYNVVILFTDVHMPVWHGRYFLLDTDNIKKSLCFQNSLNATTVGPLPYVVQNLPQIRCFMK